MASRRKIVRIDAEKCTGCGECIPNCPEGALQLIDGKARLISDLFCDGLGACMGSCPEDAISIEEREAEAYDEKKVMEKIVPQGPNTIRAHLKHLREHGAEDYYAQAVEFLKERHIPVPPPRAPEGHATGENRRPATAGAVPGDLSRGPPGSRVVDLSEKGEGLCEDEEAPAYGSRPRPNLPRLRQWPVQLALVPSTAPYLRGAELLVAADCVPFVCADFHEGLLKRRVLLVGCPKLDDHDYYEKKLRAIFEQNDISSVTVAHMEVPCCFGLVKLVEAAVRASGRTIPFAEVPVSMKGDILARA